MINSSTRCSLHSNHLYINEEGNFYQCCAKIGNTPFKDSKGEVISAYDDNWMERLKLSTDRLQLQKEGVEGIRSKSCMSCFSKEDAGLTSYRQEANSRYPKEIVGIRFLDIRFGNHCNLRCRMCYPGACSNLIPEMRVIDRKPDGFKHLEQVSWYRNKHFWKQLIPEIQLLDKLHIAGGEPLIIPEVTTFLSDLCERELAKNIDLSFNTNLTVLNDSHIELFKKFKSVSLQVSLDGIGKVNDFIRYPSDFTVVESNLKRVKENASEWNITNCSVHAVATIYSIFGLPRLELYLKENYGEFYHFAVDWVIGRECLDPRVLPQKLRRELKEYYHSSSQLLSHILEQTFSEERSFLLPEFRRWNKIMDGNRGQSLTDFIPELKALVESESLPLWLYRRGRAKWYYLKKMLC